MVKPFRLDVPERADKPRRVGLTHVLDKGMPAAQVAEVLRQQAEAQSHHDPTCRPPLATTRLPASGALEVLRAPGARNDPLPAPSTRAAGLNRRGVRLRQVVKARPQKQSKEIEAIFANITKRRPTPRPREASIACASMVKRPSTLGSVRAAVSPGATPKPALTTPVAGRRRSRVAS